MKAKIVGHIPTTKEDGSITWEYLVLTEAGELEHVPQDVGDSWLAKPSGSAPVVSSELAIGDKVVIVSSGKAGVLVTRTDTSGDVVLDDGSRVTVLITDLKVRE